MAKRVVYLYKDNNVCIIPTPNVMQLKRAAEGLFREYKYHKTTRRQFDQYLKALYVMLRPWTRKDWREL